MMNYNITTHIQRMSKEVDTALLGEIKEIVKENGLERTIILNERNIVSALKKSIPVKPNIHGYREGREINTISYTCPVCNKHTSRENYCNYCGQALDWSDTE